MSDVITYRSPPPPPRRDFQPSRLSGKRSMAIPKGDKNSIPQCIRQSHITTAFSNMAPFRSGTRVRQTCARCAVKTIKLYDILGKRKQVIPVCTGDRTFAAQTYYDGLS